METGTEQPVSGERKPEPRSVPCFKAIDKKSSKQLEDETFANLPHTDKAWLTEDVAYIIQPEERCAFLKLELDDERGQFVEQFWLRRSSNPDSPDNNFKEEHYRRIVFANEKFGTKIPGWKSDRGQVYVSFGPPDTIDSHASGEPRGTPHEKARKPSSIRGRNGITGIWKASAKMLTSSLWIRRHRETIGL
jgi:GWxTD domain-containing protein